MRPPLIKTNQSDHKEDRLTEFVKELSRFDIVCLQEVFTTFNTRKQRLISYGAKSGLSWSVVSQEPSLFSGYLTDGGLLIMSRFPIIESEFHPYPYGVLCDAISYKGVLYAKILIGDKVLHLFNTHTQATYFGVHVDDFVRFILWIHDSPLKVVTYETRMDQIRDARKYMEAKLKDAGPSDLILFAGDFNVNGHQENSIVA
jgi:endonuclease/exonuclease/phosphatase family metal-dependent hydrolase